MVNIFDTNLIKVHRTILKIRVLQKAILLLVGEKKLKCLLQYLRIKTKPVIEKDIYIFLKKKENTKILKLLSC